MTATVLRPHQVRAVSAIELEFTRVRSTLLESATGTGKTTIFSEVVRRDVVAGGRALVLVHRRELVLQAVARLRSLGLIVGIEQGSSRASVEPVVVASVQTLRGARLERWSPSAFTLVVVDEAHHAPAPGWRAIVDYFSAARVLGVTATPDRADGAALGQVFASVADRYGIAEAVRDRQLVPALGLRVEVPGMDLSQVGQRARRSRADEAAREVVDLNPAELGRAAIAPEAVEGVVVPLLELAGTRRTVVFAVNRAHARAIADALCARRPGCADVVHGAMHREARERVLARHRAGAYQFLVNVMILTEGYDDPEIACVAMARPTQSRVLYAQACGRGLRPAHGKVDCLVLDFVGVSCRYSLVGPDDVLAGALVEPTRAVRAEDRGGTPPTPPAEVAPYVSRGLAVRFATRVVELVRRAGRATKRAGSSVGRAAARTGRAARAGAVRGGRGLLRALATLLVG